MRIHRGRPIWKNWFLKLWEKENHASFTMLAAWPLIARKDPRGSKRDSSSGNGNSDYARAVVEGNKKAYYF